MFKRVMNRLGSRMLALKLVLLSIVRSVLFRKRHPFWVGIFDFEYRDKDGNLIEAWTVQNALADEGEENMLDAYLRGQNVPTTFYMLLVNDTPVETDGVADLAGEPSTNGYARQEIERSTTGWPTLALDSEDFMATSKQVTFEASGGSWGPVTYMALTTTLSGSSGPLISYVALSKSRTLDNGETLGCRMRCKLQ